MLNDLLILLGIIIVFILVIVFLLISVFFAIGEWSKNRHNNDNTNDSTFTTDI